MIIFALDPGTTHSAMVRTVSGHPVTQVYETNGSILRTLRGHVPARQAVLVIEQIESNGMAVGRSVFETVFWAGRFAEAWEAHGANCQLVMMPRRTVKLHLCGTMKAKDANIRRVLLDRWGGDEAGRKGGILYGFKSHLWAALAVAVTYYDQQGTRRTT